MKTIREVLEPSVPTWTLEHVCSVLGIDTDMTPEAVRRLLLWGERVSECCDGVVPYNYPGGYHAWITRPENVEEPT